MKWFDIAFYISEPEREDLIDSLFALLLKEGLDAIGFINGDDDLDAEKLEELVTLDETELYQLPLDERIPKLRAYAQDRFDKAKGHLIWISAGLQSPFKKEQYECNVALVNGSSPSSDLFFNTERVSITENLECYLHIIREFYKEFHPLFGYSLQETYYDEEDVPTREEITNGTLRLFYPITVLNPALVESIGRNTLRNVGFPYLEDFDDGGLLILPYKNPANEWPLPLERIVSGEWKPV